MSFNIFGFTIKKTEDEKAKEKADSFVAPTNVDGAVTVEGAGAYGTFIDLDGTAKDEFELITRYREMALYPECDYAIDDIVNQAIVLDGENPAVSLNLSGLELDNKAKDKIRLAFEKIQKLLNWDDEAYEIFRKWYVDGRLYYHIVLPNGMTDLQGAEVRKVKDGILQLRYIDPRQIRKIRVIDREKDPVNNVERIKVLEEYFIYNQRGIRYQGASTITPLQAQTVEGVKIATDSILFVHSGITDKFSSTILSNLHKAMKPLNQLKMMEDALVIYRIARAPERRIFYIDVGNLPKTKAEDYLRTVMQQYRNKMIYDVNTGEIRDDRRYMTMLEDFWLPRKDGSTGTEISTLPGGQNLGEMEDVEYFQKKLYKSLNVPISRLDNDTGFAIGSRAQEITRDELKFAKAIQRMRKRFEHLFKKLLEVELLLTGIMNRDDWAEHREKIKFKWADDNYYEEILENQKIKGRFELLSEIDPDTPNYVKKYISIKWVRTHILKQTEDEQKELDKEIEDEDGMYDRLSAEEEKQPMNFDNLSLNHEQQKPETSLPKENKKNNKKNQITKKDK